MNRVVSVAAALFHACAPFRRDNVRADSFPIARGATLPAVMLVALVVLGGAVGCGPIEYVNQVVVRSSNALAMAKSARASKYAPYEYTSAQEYLFKAKEEAGYASYQAAIDYGKKAEDLARRARDIALQKENSVLSQPASSATDDLGSPPHAQLNP